MKYLLTAAVALGLILTVARVVSAQQGTARSQEVDRPIGQVYDSLAEYFAPDSAHFFQVTAADKKAGSITARRANIDENTWNEWAYCKVPATSLIDVLEKATVVVKVKLACDSASRTYVTVTPDLIAVYGLAAARQTIHCNSKGVLEQDILAAAHGS